MFARDREYNAPEFVCALHQRRRLRSQLIDDPDHPGQLRCDPARECRSGPPQMGLRGGDENWCTCRLHGRRRLIHQMREVGTGEYECSAPLVCHDGANPRPFRPRPFGQFSESGSHMFGSGGGPPGAAIGGAGPGMPPSPFAPQTGSSFPGAVGGMPHTAVVSGMARGPQVAVMPSAYGQATYMRGMSQLTTAAAVQVWCSKHARYVDRNLCDWRDHVFFVCRDPSQCLSVPLDDPASIRGEVLCSRHQTLRLACFMRRTEDERRCEQYECAPEHACRSQQTHALTDADATSAVPTDDALGGVGFADPVIVGGGGVQGGQQPGYASSSYANPYSYHQPPSYGSPQGDAFMQTRQPQGPSSFFAS